MEKQHKYKAFISYSHQDQKFAKWLHRKIENYKIPKSLREKYPDLPKDLKRSIFIDDEELPIAAALPDNLSHALESSEILIVVSSPGATASYWVDKEIDYFKQYHGEDRVLAILKEGEPNATYSTIYDNTLEAFPKSLRYKVDKSGELTEERTEPLAADARKRSTRKKALLKLIAGILKVDFADLWKREKRETHKRWAISGTFLALFVAMGIYASVQYTGEQGNKELDRINAQIATIEYSIRHNEHPMEKITALNKELKKLKQDKENKEASIEALGKLKTSIGKKAKRVYDQEGAEAAIALLTSKSAQADQESRIKELSKEKLTLAKLYVETYRFDEAKESYQKAVDLFFDYENAMGYGNFLKTNNHLLEAIEVFEKLKKIKLIKDQEIIVYYGLGICYSGVNNFKKAEEALIKTLKLLNISSKPDSDRFQRILQEARLYLKLTYLQTNRIKEAKEIHIETQNLHPDLVPLFNVIDALFSETNVSKRTEKEYIEKIAQLRYLAKKAPDTYNPILAHTLLFLAILYDQTNRPNEQEAVILEAIDLYRSLSKINPDAYNIYFLSLLKELADLYRETNKLKKAEAIYIEVIDQYRTLSKTNPSVYSANLTRALEALAHMYINIDELKKAEVLYIESIKILKILVKQNPDVFNLYLSGSLGTLGLIYERANNDKEAEKAYLESLKIQRSSTKSDPDSMAIKHSTLAYLYQRTNRIDEALKQFLEALELYRILVKNDPNTYNPNLASTLEALGYLYSIANKNEEAEKMYLKALKIQRSLVVNNPNTYNLDLSKTLNNLASFYENSNRLKEAEELYLEALKIQRSLVKDNPNTYNLDLSWTLSNLASLCENSNRLKEAEELYLEALKIRRSLVKSNLTNTSNMDLSAILYRLAGLYLHTNRIIEAEELYLEVLNILRSLAKNNPNFYNPYLSTTLSSLSSLYRDTNRSEEATKLEKELSEVQ